MSRANGNVDLMEGRTTEIAPLRQSEEAPRPAGPSLEERLTKVEDARPQVEAELTLNRVLSDPNIREYLTKLQQGVKMKLIEDKPQTTSAQPELTEPEGDPEEMTPTQLVEFMQKKSSIAMQKTLAPMFSALQQQIEQLASVAASAQGQTVERDIQSMRAKYPDFQKLEPDMRELNNRVKGTLSLEELYRSVKGLRGEALGRGPNTASERPDGATGRETPRRTQTQPQTAGPKLGRLGFQDLVNSVLAREPSEE